MENEIGEVCARMGYRTVLTDDAILQLRAINMHSGAELAVKRHVSGLIVSILVDKLQHATEIDCTLCRRVVCHRLDRHATTERCMSGFTNRTRHKR